MLSLSHVHHIAIICTNYQRSKEFYTTILGLEIIREEYRQERASYKLHLALNRQYCIELFSFPTPPPRLSRPEAAGLRHLAFAVDDVDRVVQELKRKRIDAEPVRIDEATGKQFTFIADPDDLPIEFYQC